MKHLHDVITFSYSFEYFMRANTESPNVRDYSQLLQWVSSDFISDLVRQYLLSNYLTLQSLHQCQSDVRMCC